MVHQLSAYITRYSVITCIGMGTFSIVNRKTETIPCIIFTKTKLLEPEAMMLFIWEVLYCWGTAFMNS